MTRILLLMILLMMTGAVAGAAAVRPAPDFAVEGAGKSHGLRSFRGQAVVIVFAPNPRQHALRKELARLANDYSQFATEKVVFIAAVANGDARSNIPFVSATDPAGTAAAYGLAGKFGIAVIGKDGNLDLVTTRVIPASRVRDAIFNSYENQASARSSS